jgi:hypothetical protein
MKNFWKITIQGTKYNLKSNLSLYTLWTFSNAVWWQERRSGCKLSSPLHSNIWQNLALGFGIYLTHTHKKQGWNFFLILMFSSSCGVGIRKYSTTNFHSTREALIILKNNNFIWFFLTVCGGRWFGIYGLRTLWVHTGVTNEVFLKFGSTFIVKSIRFERKTEKPPAFRLLC